MNKQNEPPKKKVIVEETLPHQSDSPVFKGSGVKMKEPFTNQHGVVIGDSQYNSKQSPLNQWSKETNPEIMAGDEWVHPTNDIGWNSTENRELIEKKDPQQRSSLHASPGRCKL